MIQNETIMKNNTGTSKVATIPKDQKRKAIVICSEHFFMKNLKTFHPEEPSRDRKMLEKFRNSVLGQMGALVSEPPPPAQKNAK